MKQSRTHTCGELRIEHAGQTVTLAGWYDNLRRVSRELGFLVIRDFYGTTQVVVETAEGMEQILGMNKESVISVTGTVKERPAPNPDMATGAVEVIPDSIEVLGKCRYKELPFEISRSREADENVRLKYRYLDIRNPQVRDNIILRSKVVARLRENMREQGFLEITTPILTASSPEGARDYLVPSRNFPGKFYALPQAPQQFKQLLMVGGIDRYYQIAPCFRDEDARADRSPGEFYQLDMEMAFASQEDVFAVMEAVLPPIFEEFGMYGRCSKAPFKRIAYKDALEDYGSDKPDLRINLLVQDATQALQGCGFAPFAGRRIKAVVVHGCQESRKKLEELCREITGLAEKEIYWFRLSEKLEYTGGISRYLADGEAVRVSLGLQAGDFVCLAVGDTLREAQKAAGIMRKVLGNRLAQCMDREQYAFCWIVDFPMYEISEETGELVFCHNPFSMPQGGREALSTGDPLDICAYQYDIVCNGIELSSGAVRNHEPDIMVKAFELAGLSEEDVKAQFPAMYQAFCYGAPPHAGIAPGVDRMLMLLSGEESIREIIAFPMNSKAQDLMCEAPGYVSEEQLRDIHILQKSH